MDNEGATLFQSVAHGSSSRTTTPHGSSGRSTTAPWVQPSDYMNAAPYASPLLLPQQISIFRHSIDYTLPFLSQYSFSSRIRFIKIPFSWLPCPILSSTSPPLSSKHSSEARLGQCKVWWTSVKPKTVETSVQSSIQHDQVGVALLPVCFLPAHWLPTIPAQMNGDQRSVEGANILSDWRRSSSPTAVHWRDELERWIFLQWRTRGPDSLVTRGALRV